ncbi:C45 family autoproteolytic acyltransferase/hydolase [uncultured Brachyspira sp.]|uniref:C45 family autoproteolytic acyltransferase/hydolase n=1 Tax=uncultured Brachyspira sp. TaxID=221953 RepID=UPI0025DD5E24|nr:C45 family autoproteolytic acyltransferase/hydolase [uncultured Brachyspira sp.]
MYHSRFKGCHYEAGFKYGRMLARNNINILDKIKISNERKDFAKKCIPIYSKYFPEIIEEIKGISKGLNTNKICYKDICGFLFTIYAFTFDNKCSCFAFKTDNDIILAKNSDFLKDIKDCSDSMYYKLNSSYSFIGNTTAFIEMEDGINEKGLAAALTFVYPTKIDYGFNAGMIIRYILEKCSTVYEALKFLKEIPISSAQNIILADKNGNIALIECNCRKIEIIKNDYVFISNHFISKSMKEYNTDIEDDIYSNERYITMKNAFENLNYHYNLDFAYKLLSGKFGFLCQYNKKLNYDTIWSAVYSVKTKKIYIADGNPSRKKFKEDKRLKFEY